MSGSLFLRHSVYVYVSVEMCVVYENVTDDELQWIISPVTPAYIKVIRPDRTLPT